MKMRKLPGFKKHGCYCEQKIAYNYLFYQAHINETPQEKVIQNIEENFNAGGKLNHERYNMAAVQQIVSKHYDSYTAKPFIAGAYEDIAEKLTL